MIKSAKVKCLIIYWIAICVSTLTFASYASNGLNSSYEIDELGEQFDYSSQPLSKFGLFREKLEDCKTFYTKFAQRYADFEVFFQNLSLKKEKEFCLEHVGYFIMLRHKDIPLNVITEIALRDTPSVRARFSGEDHFRAIYNWVNRDPSQFETAFLGTANNLESLLNVLGPELSLRRFLKASFANIMRASKKTPLSFSKEEKIFYISAKSNQHTLLLQLTDRLIEDTPPVILLAINREIKAKL